jgi:hypothetical protein
MTLLKPQLTIKRLVISKDGMVVYDEFFHRGVNIIRGTNGSGKSTIIDFIFYGLGGDFTSWKPEAESCDNVMLELEINDTTITIKRNILKTHRQAMSIFWGSYTSASSSATEGWLVYPFIRSSNKESFSQVLFRALEFPEVKSDFQNNITMHQILRLIYIDQLTSVDLLMKSEIFDSALIRETVGDLLLGLYDDSLYKEQIQLRDEEKKLENLDMRIKSLNEVLEYTEQNSDIEALRRDITDIENQQLKIQETLDKKMNSVKSESDNTTIMFEQLREKLLPVKAELDKLLSESHLLQIDIEDSRLFIESLDKRLVALDESLETRSFLGKLPITYCPNCLSPINPSESEDICVLCHQRVAESTEKSQALRMKQELVLQIKESKQLLVEKEKKFTYINLQIPIARNKVITAQQNYDFAVSQLRSNRDAEIDTLLIKKGELDTKIQYLYKQESAIKALVQLRDQKTQIMNRITELNESIEQKQRVQEKNKRNAMSHIERHTLYFIKNDLRRENVFPDASKVEINFTNNTYKLNDRNQYSASSMTYLKNSIHLGILFASMDLAFFRYPRLLLCDDIEDKGMEQERSQNFQKLIVDYSKSFDIVHQIIFTTSMIAPELNNTDLCVGPEYSVDHKTLNIQ